MILGPSPEGMKIERQRGSEDACTGCYCNTSHFSKVKREKCKLWQADYKCQERKIIFVEVNPRKRGKNKT